MRSGGIGALIALAVSLGFTRPVHAADSIGLRWEACDGNSEQVFDCASDLGEQTLVVTASVGVDADSLIGIEAVIDLQVSAGTLPDWWSFGFGECRAGALRASLAPLGGVNCPSPWPTGAIAQIQGYSPGQPRGSQSQSRILAVASCPSSTPATLQAGTVYSLLNVVIGNAGTIGAAACPGCTSSACLVLNSVRLVRIPGATALEDLVTPGPGNATWATWQTTDGLACQAVPVRNTTWGSLKSMYR